MKRITEAVGVSNFAKSARRLFCQPGLAILVVLLLGAGLKATPGLAQTTNATLRGTVTDSSGALIVGANVTLSEPATGRVVRQAKTSASGGYEFDELQPGTYELRCTEARFTPFEARGILLDPGQVRRVDAVLAVGPASTSIVVSSGAAVINTQTPTISTTFSTIQNDRTPLVNIYPSMYSLLTTASGVQGGGGTFPVMNGMQQSNESQVFDGIPQDLMGEQDNNSNFFAESSVTTANAPAESAVPGEMTLVTHRGTNAFHGIASYKIYDSVLNASGYFPPPKTPYLQHEWNLGVGGPIFKNRAFFYGGWFAQRIPLGTPIIISVPTLAWRQGQFSQTIIDPATGSPFPNNTIPQDRISPVSLAIQNTLYPAPIGSFANLPPVNNFPFVFPFNSDLYKGDWLIGRVDYNLTKNNSLFARWLMRRTPYVLNDGVPAAVWTRLRRYQMWTIGDTHIFSPHLVNNFRLGLEFDYMDDGQPERGQTPPDGASVLSSVGLEGSNPGNSTGQGLPTINISGLTGISDVPGGQKQGGGVDTVTDTANWQVGVHSLKIGFIFQHYKILQGFVNDYGTMNFDGSITGNAYADFLLGLPQSTARSTPLPSQSQTVGNFGAYVQDAFQVTDRLTLNYGLRWDVYGTPAGDLMYNWDPTTGNVIVKPAALSKVSPLYPASIAVESGAVQAASDKSDITPRIGVAYRLGNHSVLRGGYGIYTARMSGGDFAVSGADSYNPFLLINPALGQTGPFSISQSYLNVVTPGQTPLLQFPNPYPASTSLASIPSQTVYGYPRSVSMGKIQQFSATFERQVGTVGLRASYVGSRSSGLNYQVNLDVPHPSTTPFTTSALPYPQFLIANYERYNGSAKFDGLQFEVLRRAGSLTFDGNYGFQRSVANFLDTENPYDVLDHGWANDGPTMRHYASITASWALPFGKGHRYLSHPSPIIERAAGGWVLTSLTYLGSGVWYSPLFSGSDPSNTGTFGGLPDKVGDPNSFPNGKGPLDAFNDAAFAVPQSGTFGNAKPNSLESQPLYVTHLGVLKVVPITERVNFHFTTQFSNLLNHPQFIQPSGDISVEGGNQYTSQLGVFSSLERATPRQITFQGAFTF